jgi:putative transposase
MRMNSTAAASPEALFADEGWFDPIEAGLRERIRGFIEAMLEELAAALGRGRYQRGPSKRHRHGQRERQLLGSFGPVRVSVPRARLAAMGGTTQEWRSTVLAQYQR